ncbi:MAG: retroviral-like aspartic protease family protein [Sphingomonas bacterium]|nr:retroviral-like aspartic protease family protein [Sphingomonas bacterium]
MIAVRPKAVGKVDRHLQPRAQRGWLVRIVGHFGEVYSAIVHERMPMIGPLMIAALLSGTASALPEAAAPTVVPPAGQRTTSPFISESEVARSGDAAMLPDSLAMTNDQAQRMTVMVSVGGQGPFAFLVDTGSERTAISRQLATQLGLRGGAPVRVHSTLGSEMVETVNIPQLGVGKQALSVINAPTFEAQHIGASGILGIDSLRSQRVVFDFKAREMHIAPSRYSDVMVDKDVIVVRARSREGRLILTSVTLDGIAIAAIIDTGSQMSIGNLPLMRKMERARGARDKRAAIGLGAERALIEAVTGQVERVDVAVVRRLDLGGVDLRDFTVAFSDARIFKELGYGDKPAILLGIDALRAFDKVSIDFAQKKVRLVLPEGAIPHRFQTASRW